VAILGVQISLVEAAKLQLQAECSVEHPIIPHKEIKDLFLAEDNNSQLQLGDFLVAKAILGDSNNRMQVALWETTRTNSNQVSKILVNIMNL
jgi:hypothetical protein